MAFKFNEYHLGGGGSGGGSAVLTELTVTENGVYDEPVIEEELDFFVGKTVQFKERYTTDDFPEEYQGEGEAKNFPIVSTADCIANITNINGAFGITVLFLVDGTPSYNYTYMDSRLALEMGSMMGLPDTDGGWYEQDVAVGVFTKMDNPPSIVIVDDAMATGFASAPFLFTAPSTPADGWNKVTVNVPVGEPHVPNMIPNDGSYVHNIYLNTALFADDVMPDAIVAEINKIPEECWFETSENVFVYQVCQGVDDSGFPLYVLIKKGDCSNLGAGVPVYVIDVWGKDATGLDAGGGYIEIADISEYEPEFPYMWNQCDFAGTDGSCRFSCDTSTQTKVLLDVPVKVGTANHLLTNLISIRPFT